MNVVIAKQFQERGGDDLSRYESALRPDSASRFASAGDLASAMTGVLEKHSRKVKLAGVMLALTVRKEVLEYLREAESGRRADSNTGETHPEGATADEIAYALKYSILTVRPRMSELKKMNLIVDSKLAACKHVGPLRNRLEEG
jgi:hypothetical protein